MAFHFICKSKGARCYNYLLSFLLIIIFLSFVAEARKNEPVPINIGAIIDADSRVGKEQHVAMNMAVRSFNNASNSYRLSLHFRSIGNNPIQAVSAAEELIREKQVKVIIGLQTWEQTVLVADSVGNRHRIPILSFGHSSHRAMFLQQRWPFLLPMVPNSLDQVSCITDIIGSFKWRKVVVIYEENIYGGIDSELITALSETLQAVDAEIESHLVLPPPSSVPDAESMIRDEMSNLLKMTQSRVFVVFRSSSPLASLLFQEAKRIGLMGRDSVWILGDSLSDLLDSFEPSVLTFMQGSLGIKSHFREDSKPFSRFRREFQINLRLEFPDEHRLEPGIHSLRAYDAITALSKAVVELGNNAPESFLKVVRSINFTGLSGEVHLHGDEALSSEAVFRIVNIVGRSYKELAIWSPQLGFADSVTTNVSESSKVESMKELGSFDRLVNWPGELNRVPRGWTMPTDAKPMRIGVPGNTTFPEFVKVPWPDVTDINKYDGFCIDVFREVLKIVEQDYAFPYEFVPINGSYNSYVDHVFRKNVSAFVGDITILSNRSKYVDFTHPFAESGLSMTVKVKQEYQKAWMFMKPFTNNMWFATFLVMFYTMFVVWFMEHQTNPQFKGSWKDQLGTAMWFTFSTLFFAHTEARKNEPVPINIGAIIDVDSRVGKEQHVAMNMAVRSFNNASNSYRLSLHFRSIRNNPIQAVSAAEELIREKQVKVIIGLQTWEQTVLVADSVGNRHRIPILSFGHSSHRAMFLQQRWPFLLPMVPNSLDQVSCITDIIGSFKWRKVVVIYEENIYGGIDSELITALSETLQAVDAEIESHLVLPPPSSVPDAESMIRDEMTNLLNMTQSRVFVVLRSSLPLASLLFQEAKRIGLIGRDSVWILGDSLSDLLDSFEPSVLTFMQGSLGIKSHFREDSKPFSRFRREFQINLRLEFPDEHRLVPGIHSLRAYDAITALSKAVVELGNNAPESFLKVVRSINFTGLSGEVHLHGDEALSSEAVFRIVNIVGRSYKELAIWSPQLGFADSVTTNVNESSKVESMKELGGFDRLVNWPGELNRVPRGWTMPTDAKPMRIGVPGNTTFPEFVKVPWPDVTDINKYKGFCIDVFREVLKIVEQDYALPYEFVPINGSYNSYVDDVFRMDVSAFVGDITILSNRSKYVDFTHPFAESGLSMTVKVKQDYQKAWMFMKPFTNNMWFATFLVMFYTMFVVWFMEHQTNPQFKGSWKDQLGTAMWFTFSTLFFAHRETIKSNYSKGVLVVWFFLVFVLTSNYQASLTSMLTVPRLEPNVTNIEWIRRTNAPVGCDGDSYVNDYLKDVLNLTNIKTIPNSENYPEEFSSGNITAAFLELPYQKVFLQQHCKDYTVTGPTYRNGGLGFVFEKGSPIARDFSKAILILLEDGTLAQLQNRWFGSSMNCSNSDGPNSSDSLHFESFWGLFLISACTTTFFFLIFVYRLLRRTRDQSGELFKEMEELKGL